MATSTCISLGIDDISNDTSTEIVSAVCRYEWTNKLVLDADFRNQWQERIKDDADSDVARRNLIVISLVGDLANDRQHVANCFFRIDPIVTNSAMDNESLFMTYFESSLLNRLVSPNLTVLVCNYDNCCQPNALRNRREESFHAKSIVEFSFHLSTIVVLCYSSNQQFWTNSLDSIWEMYVRQL